MFESMTKRESSLSNLLAIASFRKPAKLSKSTTRSNAKRAGMMELDVLEIRRLCSSSLSYDGQLSVAGTQYMDFITVSTNGSVVTVTQNVAGQPATTANYQAVRVHYIAISGYEGNDMINNNTAVPSYIDSGPGDDAVNGGLSNDYIYGRDGNDIISGLAGNDYIDAGNGNNGVFGGFGNDSIIGYNGIDTLVGGDGNDIMWGYGGNDQLFGGNGNDSLIAGAGNDSVFGENGSDYLWGEDGNDFLVGGTTDNSPDLLIGGGGNDTFATHWVWTGSWQNFSRAYDFHNQPGLNDVDTWVNP
jgi:Ca2+-binding RTX toxin-like protein